MRDASDVVSFDGNDPAKFPTVAIANGANASQIAEPLFADISDEEEIAWRLDPGFIEDCHELD